MIELPFKADISGLKRDLEQLKSDMNGVKSSTDDNKKAMQSAFSTGKDGAKQLSTAIRETKGYIRELEREEQKLAKAAQTGGSAEKRRWKEARLALREHKDELDKLTKKQQEYSEAQKSQGKGIKDQLNDFKSLAIVAASIYAVKKVFDFGVAAAKAWDVQIQAETRLLTALKGRKDIQVALIQQAGELQKVTLFGDEQTIAAAGKLATIIGNNKDQIQKILPLAQDLATAFGIDLESAATMVGRAVNGNVIAFQKMGIGIEKTNDKAKMFENVVKTLNERVGGQAEAAALVGIGAYKQLGLAIGDLVESIGSRIVAGDFNEFIRGITDLANTASDKVRVKSGESAKILTEELQRFAELDKTAMKHNLELRTKDLDTYTKKWENAKESNDFKNRKHYFAQIVTVKNFLKEATKIMNAVDFVPDVEIKTAYELLKEQVEALNKKMYDEVLLTGKVNGETQNLFITKSNRLKQIDEEVKKTGLLINLFDELSRPEVLDPEPLKELPESLWLEENKKRLELENRLLTDRLKNKKDILDKDFLSGKISTETYQAEIEKLEIEHMNRLLEIRKRNGEDTKDIEEKLQDKLIDGKKKSNTADAKDAEDKKEAEKKKREELVKNVTATAQLALDAFGQIAQIQVDIANQVVAAYDRRIDSARFAVETELALNEQGIANNLDLKRAELAKLEEQRQGAIKEQEKALARQRTIESISQGLNIATSISAILKSAFTKGGIFGALIAPVVIGGLFALWSSSLAKTKALPKFASGGFTGNGFYKDSTGQRVAGIVHNDEYVASAAKTRKYRPILEAIEKDMPIGGNVDIDSSTVLNGISKKMDNSVTYFGKYKIVKTGNVTRKIHLS